MRYNETHIKNKGEFTMKNIIEGIKTNKGNILKGLVAVGALVGLAIVGKELISKETDEDEYELDDTTDTETDELA